MSRRTVRILLAAYPLTLYATLGMVRLITNTLRDRGITLRHP